MNKKFLYYIQFKIMNKISKFCLKHKLSLPFIRYYENYWIHIVDKHLSELNNRYYSQNISRKNMFCELKKLFSGKIVIPFMDTCVCTYCTLNCRDCTEWIPYVQNKKLYSAEEIIKNFETMFKNVDYVHFLSPIGGEPFLNKELNTILDYLEQKCSEGKIGYVRVVTNGTILPSEEILNKFKNPKFSILISNYDNVLTESQTNNKQKLIEYLENNNINYFSPTGFKWIDLGTPKKGTPPLQAFSTCFLRNCVLFVEGKIYRCPRSFVLDNNSMQKMRDCEMIDFNEIKNKKELKKKLYEFYSADYINACQWCNNENSRNIVEPAIQLMKGSCND